MEDRESGTYSEFFRRPSMKNEDVVPFCSLGALDKDNRK